MRPLDELRAAEEFFHAQIPLTRAMGVRAVASDESGFTVEAPVALNYNHLRTAFGGSINAVATLAAYGFLWLELHGHPAEVLIADSSMRFLRTVRETIRARCHHPGHEEIASFKATLEANGKARIALRVSVEEHGCAAAEFRGTFVALRNFQRA
jgi:thioesterase domain-containing protein